MAVQIKFGCGHRIAVALIDREKLMICPFCEAQAQNRDDTSTGWEVDTPDPYDLNNAPGYNHDRSA